MISLAAFALVAAQVLPQSKTVVRDSTRPDSAAVKGRRPAPIRRAVTAELRESAFHDAASRDLIGRARVARISQDSSILGYDARVAQRLSVKAAIGSVALERLAYRHEGTARVQWQRGLGAHIDVTGARVSIPMIGMPKVERDALQGLAADPQLVPIPYFPGQEPLWVGAFMARPDVNELDLINPLANGAEAYYTYRSGEAATIRLANGDSLVVRQVDVRPRTAAPNLIVGSLWLDNSSGQVVRAAYRLAAPGKGAVSVSNPDSTGKQATGAKVMQHVLKALIPAMSADITDVVVEYQRVRNFWLPRSQVMEGFVKSSFAKVPVTWENAFRFESVNETSGLAPISVDTMSTRDSVVNGEHTGSLKQCKTSDTRVVTAYKLDSMPISMRVPCDLDKLASSGELPKSAFDAGEEIFGTAQRDELIGQALSLMDQAPFSWTTWPAPDFTYGVSQTRYNRIEGLSSGILMTQQLGAGLDIHAAGRIATADHTPRWEFSLGRSNAAKTIRLGGYDRLVSAMDWEDPLTFGSSLSAFFFGRDDAFYYRASGVELTGVTERGPGFEWRVFYDRQATALTNAEFSVGGSFGPNIVAANDWFFGASAGKRWSYGLRPRGFRMTTDLRLEGGVPGFPGSHDIPVYGGGTFLSQSDSVFGRASLELAMSRGIGSALDGALTLAGGTSAGILPTQRLWYLGGTQTIRGIAPDPAIAGNAYWFTRGELALPVAFMRLAAFGDIGWTGDREKLSEVGRPLSGVGLGFSFLDGAIRLDVARGIYPTKGTRVSFYLGSRF